MDTIRILMLLSLFLQTILAFFGDRRKYATGFWLRFVVWLAYMSADWVATFLLGFLACSQANSANPNLIPGFWAPILLLHLGGPETITAYSLVDNELWRRHLLELVIQAGVASYVLFKLWSRNTIIFVAIPIFVSGIIKYGERIWAFRFPRLEDFRTKDISSGSSSGYEVKNVREARRLFGAFQMLSTNTPVFDCDQTETYKLVSTKHAEETFQLIEIELGFLYDRLYSKVTEISWPRVILHSITCLCSISALIFFSIMTMRKNVYSKHDTMISYLLLVGAVLLDCHSITVLLLSDWAVIWFTSNKAKGASRYRINCLSPLLSLCRKRKRWSRSMGQHILTSAQSNKPVNELRKQYFAWELNSHSREDVSNALKELIFEQVMGKRSRHDPHTSGFNVLELLAERGVEPLRRKGCFEKLGWSVAGVEFTESLLIWHVATRVCYIADCRDDGFSKERNCVMSSRSLSNYMLYLLVYRPAMLATELPGTRYAETTSHLGHLLSRKTKERMEGNSTLDEFDALSVQEVDAFFKKLLENPSTVLKEIEKQENVEKSALLDGCMLGLSLQSLSLKTGNGWSNEKKWEMISEVWVEMLMYAASHCKWKEHADTLARGGELLTHVCLLMTHLGLSKQYCPPELKSQVEARKKRFDDFLETVSVCEV